MSYEFGQDVSPIDLGIDYSVDMPFFDNGESEHSRRSRKEFESEGGMVDFFGDDSFDVGFNFSKMTTPFGGNKGFGFDSIWNWGSSKPKQPKRGIRKIEQKPRKKLGLRHVQEQEQVHREPPRPQPGAYHKPFTKENVAELENRPGIYRYYDKNKKLIYIGRSHVIRHRVQSYYQKDDFNEHPTKEALRKEIAYFNVEYKSPEEARNHEHKVKNGLKHNHN